MADRNYLRSRKPRHNKGGARWVKTAPKVKVRLKTYGDHARSCPARLCREGGCAVHRCNCLGGQ